MRTTWDRIRQAVSFELIGLLVVTPLASWIFGASMRDIGILAVAAATVATIWNYLYNLGFDHLLRWRRGSTRKTLALRVVHAIGFEVGILLVTLPLIAWWLGISLLDAFVMDVFFAVFYIAYAFVFTWAYDMIFPVPDPVGQT